jgi:glycosyltransferase involved in cell wall biosynthesis
VVVAPIRVGAGTRIKILEALAMARAVVATPAAAEGLRLAPGEELIVAAEPDAFAAAVARLAGDAAARQRLGQAGRARVLAEYDWEITLAALTRAVAGLAGRRPSDAWAR